MIKTTAPSTIYNHESPTVIIHLSPFTLFLLPYGLDFITNFILLKSKMVINNDSHSPPNSTTASVKTYISKNKSFPVSSLPNQNPHHQLRLHHHRHHRRRRRLPPSINPLSQNLLHRHFLPSQTPPHLPTHFSPLKRLRTSQLISPTKKPKLPSNSDSQNPTLHQKFLNKLLEPHDQDTQIASTSNNNPKYTPLEQQVVDLKSKHKDVLLMIEVGYKFRFFGKDAEDAARVLGIYAHMDHNILTASILTFRLHIHVRRLVSAGYKVGVVKQTETASIKAHESNKLGPFCRGLSALYTKATLEAAEDVGGGEEGCGSCNNYLVCVVDNGIGEIGIDVKIGIVGVKISTGDVIYGEFDDNVLRNGLEAKMLSLCPAELLLGDPLSKLTEKFLVAYAGPASNVRIERASRDRYKDGGALAEVLSSYDKIGDNLVNDTPQGESVELEGKTKNQLAIMGMPELVVQALALTINHLKQFGLERILCLGDSFRPLSNNVEMTLSANAMQQLEVLKNNTNGSE
ncbi:hypothetical protein L1987_15491 [Smallanthus sonchifolius]|uniref:Uncharacterized protein n=1 Tax=Smallanthus sonchifolius TaxID=185202 RepID=A0ACB9J6J4_9ASTR|nr:hypothetical protein L1987_15491 [Smallanthus sonchifolius]